MSCISHQASRETRLSFTYLLQGLKFEASKYSDLHRTIRLQWYQIDAAQASLLETSIDHMKPQHAGETKDFLSEQLFEATKLLNKAMLRKLAPSSLLIDGQMISEVLV